MEGRWPLFSGKSSLHKFGQSGLRAPPIATYGVLSPHSKGKTQASHLAFPGTGDSYGGIKWPWGHQPQASLTRRFLALRPLLEGHPETQGLWDSTSPAQL